MKLAVCLLTADRPEYTADTVLSFCSFADEPGFIRLHADDGSERRDNIQIAAAGDFETVYATVDRRGPLAALRCMWAKAASLGASHILHLENDIEFVAPLPRFEAECVRLYGEHKARSGPRMTTGPHVMGTKEPIEWKPLFSSINGTNWSHAKCHWAGMPSITETALLLRAVMHAETFKDISMSLQRIETLRPDRNITYHFGDSRTPNAKYNV